MSHNDIIGILLGLSVVLLALRNMHLSGIVDELELRILKLEKR